MEKPQKEIFGMFVDQQFTGPVYWGFINKGPKTNRLPIRISLTRGSMKNILLTSKPWEGGKLIKKPLIERPLARGLLTRELVGASVDD